MTHTYKVTGMTCNKCAASVKKALEGTTGVTSVQVTLEPPQVVVTMEYHVPTDVLNKALKAAGNYSIAEPGSMVHEEHEMISEEKKPFFTAYKPVLLVFAYLAAVIILNEIYHGGFDIMRAMHLFMGGFFLVFSFFKMLDLKGFAYSYMTYDIIAKRWIGWGFVYPFIELALGLAYLFHFQILLTSIVTFIVMALSSVGVIQSLISKRRIQCACLGTVFNLPMSNITLIEDSLMASMAAAMLFV